MVVGDFFPTNSYDTVNSSIPVKFALKIMAVLEGEVVQGGPRKISYKWGEITPISRMK